jgi:S-methylmethionine-dependent homocysteine/selenocysteine methylase
MATAKNVSFAQRPGSAAYRRLTDMLSDGRCVVLDGGVATELETVRRDEVDHDRDPWGSWALRFAPADVLDVHRRYVEAGCDLITTNTWSLIELVEADWAPATANSGGLPRWTELARTAIRLARHAISDAGREDSCAVAFALNEDVARPGARTVVEALTWVFDDDPPDLVLLETLSRFPDERTWATIDMLIDAGIPVWVSFRRCRYGFCSSLNTHSDPDDGEQFYEVVAELERCGVGAVLLNCVRPDDLTGAISTLRGHASVPLGVYPRIGRATPESWLPDRHLTPSHYANLALGWREEGAQIIGGCCGVTPAHVRAVAALVKRPNPAGPRSSQLER